MVVNKNDEIDKKKSMKWKDLGIKDKIIIVVIIFLIIAVPVGFKNYTKVVSQNNSVASKYSARLDTQVLVTDKNIKYKRDEKVTYNEVYIYFYADDIYTEKNYGNGYIKIDRNNNVDVSADTSKLKDLLLNVKYYKY